MTANAIRKESGRVVLDLRAMVLAQLAEIRYQVGELLAVQISYRYQVVYVGVPDAVNEATFADGVRGTYTSFVRLTRPNGSHIQGGGTTVAVLPDKRMLLVVERRPAQGRVLDRPHTFVLDNGQLFDLSFHGPYASLEFSSGGADPNEPVNKMLERELWEETGTKNKGQKGKIYIRERPYFNQGSDLDLFNKAAVVYLGSRTFQSHVKADGGLTVLAFSEAEVRRAVEEGVILASQAGVVPWYFYEEVRRLRQKPEEMQKRINAGYISCHDINL